MKPLRVDEAARAELLHESQYFERAPPGYGKKFVAEIKSIFAQVKRNPEAGKSDEEGCRRLRARGDAPGQESIAVQGFSRSGFRRENGGQAMINSMSYKGYTTSMFFDAEDKIIVGRVHNVDDIISFHGE